MLTKNEKGEMKCFSIIKKKGKKMLITEEGLLIK